MLSPASAEIDGIGSVALANTPLQSFVHEAKGARKTLLRFGGIWAPPRTKIRGLAKFGVLCCGRASRSRRLSMVLFRKMHLPL